MLRKTPRPDAGAFCCLARSNVAVEHVGKSGHSAFLGIKLNDCGPTDDGVRIVGSTLRDI